MKKKKKLDWKVLCLAISAITTLEVIALLKGINGKVFSIAIALIALIAGVAIPNPFESK